MDYNHKQEVTFVTHEFQISLHVVKIAWEEKYEASEIS